METKKGDWDWEWWAIGSGAQLLLGINSYRRGYNGTHPLIMPVTAWAVATLFVGSAASASVAALRASGIRNVEDFSELGANIRTRLGRIPSQPSSSTTNTRPSSD